MFVAAGLEILGLIPFWILFTCFVVSILLINRGAQFPSLGLRPWQIIFKNCPIMLCSKFSLQHRASLASNASLLRTHVREKVMCAGKAFVLRLQLAVL